MTDEELKYSSIDNNTNHSSKHNNMQYNMNYLIMPYDSQNLDAEPVYNVPKWLTDNESSFKPPVCNKLMYGQQLKVMFVGGPNVRKDYHIECGEEFFYQIKGNISLPIYERGCRKVINITEGQVFLLRSKIPHSPQRPEMNSIGLVIERERLKSETDAIRYYVCDFDENEKDVNRILWEKWFYCSDLATELPPVLKEFHSSKEFESHEPSDTSVCSNPPIFQDLETGHSEPFHLLSYIDQHRRQLRKHKILDLFSGSQTMVRILSGPSEFRKKYQQETWIYVLVGECMLEFDYPSERNSELMKNGDCLIVNAHVQYRVSIANEQSLVMLVSMDVRFPTVDPKAPPTKYDHEKKSNTPWENMKERDPHYHRRLIERGATEEELDVIDANVTLDTQ